MKQKNKNIIKTMSWVICPGLIVKYTDIVKVTIKIFKADFHKVFSSKITNKSTDIKYTIIYIVYKLSDKKNINKLTLQAITKLFYNSNKIGKNAIKTISYRLVYDKKLKKRINKICSKLHINIK